MENAYFIWVTWMSLIYELHGYIYSNEIPHVTQENPSQQVTYTNNPCPLYLKVNHSNFCDCSSNTEIICYDLDAVPEFIKDSQVYRSIDMRKQYIREIGQNTFFNLQVQKISLDYNPIGSRISESALSGLDGVLQELSLGACGIRELPRNLLTGLIQLKHLHLWNNSIRTIPPNFFDWARELVEVVLWGNNIKVLDKNTFSGLRNLQRLDLDHNRITQLSGEYFRHLGNLQALYLGHNRIRALQADTFAPLRNLRVLNLDNNDITYLHSAAFKGLSSLLSLSLDHNSMGLLPEAIFSEMRNLTYLYLQSNQLEGTLWAIHLTGLRSLQSLNLSGNKISSLPEGIFKPTPALKQLYLDYNLLMTLKRDLFAPETHLQLLSLIGNPMNCRCDVAWIASLQSNGSSVWGACNESSSGLPLSIADELNYSAKC